MNVYPWHKKVTNYLRVFGWTFLILGGLFGLAVWFLTGCNSQKSQATSDTGDASADSNLVKMQLDSLIASVSATANMTAKVAGDVAALKATTSQPVNQSATGENAANTTAQNNNTGGLILQYAPVAAAGGGIAVLLAWLGFTWRTRQVDRDAELETAKLDLERDKHTIDALAGMKGCQWKDHE